MRPFLCGISFISLISSSSFAVNSFSINNTQAIEEVEVRGYQKNILGLSLAAVEGTISDVELEARPVLRTGEILEFVPGMVVTQHSGSGKANQYFLRGFNLDHGTDFSTHVDGMPVNMRSHGHGQGYTDLNFIIPELINTIEYRKGPYYADVGDFSGAGAARFSLKNTLADNQLHATLGEYDYQRWLITQDFSVASGNFLLGIEAQTYAGPWQDINEDVKKKNIQLRFSQALGEGDFSLTLMAYENTWNAADQIPERAVTQGLIDRLGSLDKDVGGKTARYSLSSQWKNSDWNMNAYWIQSDLHLFSNFTYFLSNPVDGDEFEQVDDRYLLGGEVARHWDFVLFDKLIKQDLGVELRKDSIAEVGLYNTAARERLSTTRQDQLEQQSLAFYSHTQIALSEKIRTHLGLRHDYMDADVESNLAVNSGSASDGITSLKLGFSYAFNPQLETYFNFGQGYHSNDARGATIVIDPVSGDPADSVDLLSRSQGVEWGMKLFDDQGYNLSASIWTLELDSELIFVGDAGNTEPSRASQRSGVEVAGYFWFTNAWTIDVELAWTRARFIEDETIEGRYVDGSLPIVASTSITYAPAAQGFYANARLRYFGSRYLDTFGDQRGEKTALVNLGTGYKWKQLKLGLEVFNLFDNEENDIDYFYPSRLTSEGLDGVEDKHFHPAEPRSLQLSLSYSY
jgi:TonB dependent receptor/TonB-dependent Receptor Plug Domain